MADDANQTGQDPVAAMHEVASQFKDALETKNWTEMRKILPSSVWVGDHNESKAEFLKTMQDALANAEDVELSLSRILNSETEDDGGLFSATAQISFSDAESWAEQEADFDIHLAFECDKDGKWKLDSLGFTNPTEEDDDSPAPASYFSAPSYFKSSPGSYFGASPSYFSEPAPSKGKHHLVYLPTVMHEDTLRSLLSND